MDVIFGRALARVGGLGRRVCRKLVRHINHAFVIVQEGGERESRGHCRIWEGSEERRDAFEDAVQRASGPLEKICSIKSWALRNLIGMRDDSHCCNMVVLQCKRCRVPLNPFKCRHNERLHVKALHRQPVLMVASRSSKIDPFFLPGMKNYLLCTSFPIRPH